MQTTNFTFALIVQARELAKSINIRVSNYRQGPKTFRVLTGNLDLLARNIDKVDGLAQSSPSALPAGIPALFNSTLENVREGLQDVRSTMEEDCSWAFARPDSRVGSKIISLAYRTLRATAIKATMGAMETKVKDLLNQVNHLIVVMAPVLKIQEHQEMLLPMLRERQHERGNCNVPTFPVEKFRPARNAPAILHTFELNFDEDAEGGFLAPEGALKLQVLASPSSDTITAAAGAGAGALSPAQCIVGMAGVGKTIALQGLAADKDILARFPDGIQYMACGQGATLQTVIREIANILRLTGATANVAAVKSSTSLREAVDCAVAWFQGKVCLFLVDDLWPTEACKTGYLDDLRQLLRGSPQSRMAITTRSVPIALGAGSVVEFGARDPLGSISYRIFMKYVKASNPSDAPPMHGRDISTNVSEILSWCGGLPIALSVAGSAVALLVRSCGSFETACKFYVADFQEGRTGLGDAPGPHGESLNFGISLSLKYLRAEFTKLREKSAPHLEHSISDLYESFCVLKNQLWIPVSVFCRMWKVTEKCALDIAHLFSGMSLATLSFRKVEDETGMTLPFRKVEDESVKVPGITLHDLHLDFCRQRAREKKAELLWHARLLNGYLEASANTFRSSVLPETGAFCGQLLKDIKSRSWWSNGIPNDGYIHANLARHLQSSNNAMELAALLLDVRWTHLRGKVGGILALKSDFDFLDKFLADFEDTPSSNIRKSFKLLFRGIRLSWGRCSEGIRSFHFQMIGRFLRLRETKSVVDAYVKSVVTRTPKPYLMPVNQFFPDVDSAHIMELPVGGICYSVACSPCGRYIAAGAGSDVVIADAKRGKRIKQLRGHSNFVSSITFAAGSKKIISGSHDNTVMIWEWETSDLPVQVLEGHADWIHGVAVSSECKQIYSGSKDRTLRIWDWNTGMQTAEVMQSSEVLCLAISPDGRKIAVGLGDGTLEVIDSCTGESLFEDAVPQQSYVESLAFSPDGLLLATGSRDETIRVWSTETWKTVGDPLEGHGNSVKCVSFSPQGHKIVSGACDGTMRAWDVADGSCDGITPRFSVQSATFSSDGQRIISGSSDGILRIWDAVLEKEPKELIYGHESKVNGVAISNDGLRIASASEDRTVRLWDAQNGDQIGIPLEGHTDSVICVTFSSDRRKVMSGSMDKTLRIWDMETYTQIGNPLEGYSRAVHCATFSSDGVRIVSGGFNQSVQLRDAHTGDQIGELMEGQTGAADYVSETSDGNFVVCRDDLSKIIIWNRASKAFIWQSPELDAKNEITDDEAEQIIRSCGQETPHLWPESFPAYRSEVFCEKNLVYSEKLGEKMLLGDFPSSLSDWDYDLSRKVFAAGLTSGAVAICRFVEE